MSIHTKFLLYFLALHLFFTILLIRDYARFGFWVLILEAALLLSLFYGARLAREIKEPFDFLKAGADNLKEGNYGIRYLETRGPELGQLIQVYNHMLQTLQDERSRLGERRGFLEELLKATPAGIITFDFDQKISTVNPRAERFLDAPGEALMGKTLPELATPLALKLVQLPLGSAKLLTLQGRRRLRCQKSHFRDRGFSRSFILIEELTEELQLSEKAAYEKLIRMMSHEINNTIGSTNSLLDSCLFYRERLPGQDRTDFETAIKVVISRNEHLNAFMGELADVVRLPQPRRQMVDLLELLQSVVLLLSVECEKRDIQWIWEVGVSRVSAHMDRHQMELVFMNIVKNAIEAVGSKGSVTIAIDRPDHRLRASIIDTGQGLTPEVQQNLFTPFYSTKDDGQGIGLILIREILTRHRFDFALEGGAGQDTRFTVWFGEPEPEEA